MGILKSDTVEKSNKRTLNKMMNIANSASERVTGATLGNCYRLLLLLLLLLLLQYT